MCTICWIFFQHRLPVKSIIRFEIVSKSWFSIFQTPFFNEKHLHCSTQNGPALLLQRWVDGRSIFQHTNPILLLSKTKEPQFLSPCFDFIIGVSNGLVCCCSYVYDLGRFLFLWNPATRKYRQILLPKFCVDLSDCCFGFCFNSNDNDYKIVKLNAFRYNPMVFSVQMFSLRSGSWKEISLSNYACEFSSENLSVNVSGCMFWMLKRNEESCVLSFDTGSEECKMITVPSYNERANIKLEVYENSLALLVDSVIGPNCIIELWVLDEQQRNNKLNIVESLNPNPLFGGFFGNHWKKMHTIELGTISQHPLGVWQNELLFREGQLIYGHRGFKASVPSSGLLSPRSFYYVFKYEESLVSLDGGNGVDEMMEQEFIESFFPVINCLPENV